MKVGVLGLQGDVREHVRAVESAGGAPVVVKRPDELAGVDALVIPGGESTTIGKLLELGGLLAPLKERAGRNLPLFGTCAGAILMASGIVGEPPGRDRLAVMDIGVRRNAYGSQVESFETDVDVTWLDGPVRAAFIRAPMIERVGEDVEVLAAYEDRPVLVRQGYFLASTFHPEIAGEARVHELFLDTVCSGGDR